MEGKKEREDGVKGKRKRRRGGQREERSSMRNDEKEGMVEVRRLRKKKGM